VYGSGVYSFNSSICLAAIHSGVIEDGKGGLGIVGKTKGQRVYLEKEENLIMSKFADLRAEPPYAFTMNKFKVVCPKDYYPK